MILSFVRENSLLVLALLFVSAVLVISGCSNEDQDTASRAGVASRDGGAALIKQDGRYQPKVVVGDVACDVNLTALDVACPVMNMTAAKEISVEYKGVLVYLCCKDCLGKFNANPTAFVDFKSPLQKQDGIYIPRETNETVACNGDFTALDVACPVMDMAAAKEIEIGYKGVSLHFCCWECIDKFNVDPRAFIGF